MKECDDKFKVHLQDCGIPQKIIDGLEGDWMFGYDANVSTALMKLVTSTPKQKNFYNQLNKGFTQFKNDDAIVNVYRTEHHDKVYTSLITVLFLSGIQVNIPVEEDYKENLIPLIISAYADEVLNKL